MITMHVPVKLYTQPMLPFFLGKTTVFWSNILEMLLSSAVEPAVVHLVLDINTKSLSLVFCLREVYLGHFLNIMGVHAAH